MLVFLPIVRDDGGRSTYEAVWSTQTDDVQTVSLGSGCVGVSGSGRAQALGLTLSVDPKLWVLPPQCAKALTHTQKQREEGERERARAYERAKEERHRGRKTSEWGF